jgi:hypothetical protein
MSVLTEGWKPERSGPPLPKIFAQASYGTLSRSPLGDLGRNFDSRAPVPMEDTGESWDALWGRSLKVFATTSSADSSTVASSLEVRDGEVTKGRDDTLQAEGEGWFFDGCNVECMILFSLL